MFSRPGTFTALLSLLILSASCFGGSPGSAVEDFYSNVEQGEIEAALQMFSQSSVNQFPREKLKAVMQDATREVNNKGGMKEFQIVEENTIGEISEIQVRIVYGNGEVAEETVSLVKEDGKWKLEPKK